MFGLKELASKTSRRIRTVSDLVALWRLWKSDSYLKTIGWFNSHFAALPVDAEGRAIPWITYAAMRFLEDRIEPQMSVFEYGSGNSTIWWSRHVSKVVSCEHDADWFQRLKPMLPSTVEYVHCELAPDGEYSKVVERYNHAFDMIVVDGKDRVRCVTHCLAGLKSRGVIVWDDSSRPEYQTGYDFLKANGFKRLDFWGARPVKASGSCTSLFYRSDNCLGI